MILGIKLHPQQIKNMFGCYYEDGDEVVLYHNFWDNGYILLRNEKVVTYYKLK